MAAAPAEAPFEIADAHQHVGDLSEALGAWPGAPHTPEQERAARAAAMQSLGIGWAAIQPAHSYLKPDGIRDTRRVNDGIAAYRKADPRRFPIALGTVEPSHGERSLAEIERGAHELGLDGFSWHHRLQGGFIDSPWMRPYLARMAELGLVPVIHTNAESRLEAPWRLQRLAYEFPQLRFLALDAFFSYEQSTEVLFLAERTPNIVWDLGGPSAAGLFPLIESAVRSLGSERFCFSANLSYAGIASSRPPELLERILESGLSREHKANLLAGSLRRLFPRAPAPPA
jgi:predicted TIM-barrel fold metal-dependent hydrolase